MLTNKVREDDQMVRLQDDLEHMTLNSYYSPARQSIYQDARGQKSGNTPGRTTSVYVDGSPLDELEANIRMVARVVAEPIRYIFAAPSQEADQYTEGRDDLTADELDAVLGYMHNPMHDIMSAKWSKDETKCWEDDSIASTALMAMHLSVQCLTIRPTKMSREEETPPRMEIFTGRNVESIAHPEPLRTPAPSTRNKTKSTCPKIPM